ncbi:hypothetical protein [Thermasporomyces composti]|uniref:hypothetical protein n=1 Tax=Thermasporomyces composti TaxID=696763 RepID=UPI0011C02098|nr:hypothetical protein [Thermasporomyces composti]
MMKGQGMIRAFLRRGVTMGVTCATVVLATSTSASAATASSAPPGLDLSPLEVLGIFGGIPVGLFLLISLLVMAPDLIRRGSQTSLSWSGPPEWFGARPAEAGTPLERTGDSPELGSDQPRGEGASSEGGAAGRGGAGGQW